MFSSAQTEKCYLSLVMRVGWFRHELIPCSGFVAEDKKGFNTPTMSKMSKKDDVLMWNQMHPLLKWKHKVST